jgi:excisionase family DNA binding protein
VREAANFLRVAPKTIYGLVSQRRIPFRKAGRRLLFLESELLEWTRPPADRRDRYRDLPGDNNLAKTCVKFFLHVFLCSRVHERIHITT